MIARKGLSLLRICLTQASATTLYHEQILRGLCSVHHRVHYEEYRVHIDAGRNCYMLWTAERTEVESVGVRSISISTNYYKSKADALSIGLKLILKWTQRRATKFDQGSLYVYDIRH
jgi:hypothetical protein